MIALTSRGALAHYDLGAASSPAVNRQQASLLMCWGAVLVGLRFWVEPGDAVKMSPEGFDEGRNRDWSASCAARH